MESNAPKNVLIKPYTEINYEPVLGATKNSYSAVDCVAVQWDNIISAYEASI